MRGWARAVVVVVVTVASAISGSVTGAQDRKRVVRLERAVDGDTLELRDSTRVRLIGVDTPETKHPTLGDECFGEEATDFIETLLKPGVKVRLVLDVDSYDQYDRLLAYVYRKSDGLFINAELVRQGYAFVDTVPPNVEHAAQFRRLAREAREESRGLWSSCPATDAAPVPLADTGGGCLPDYEGACVPPAPPDLDCDDIGVPLRVVGDDPHSLDADDDGAACEPSPVP
jgi:micrococcal nuclease